MAYLHTDGIPAYDELGREKFAKEIANNIIKGIPNGSESFVIGINGKWGVGKSTLLKYIENALNLTIEKEQENLVILSFDPWLYSGQEHLQSKFFIELSNQLKIKKKGDEELLDLLADFLKVTANEQMLNASIASLDTHVAGTGFILKIFLSILAGVIRRKKKKLIARQNDLSNQRANINNKLIASNTRLIIFIDDIDRIYPDEIAEIFKLVKLNLNFTNTVFIISYDKDIVEEALRKKFGDNWAKYPEKIIQVDFTVPFPNKNTLGKIFIREIAALFSELDCKINTKEIQDYWEYLGLKRYFQTIRDIKRYINSLRFRLPFIKDEVYPTEFIVIEAMRLFDYEVYKFIYHYFHPFGDRIRFKESKKTLDDNLKENSIYNEETSYLVNRLFDISRNMFPGKFEGKLIQRTENFEKYFALGLADYDVEQKILDYFLDLENDEDRFNIMVEIYTLGKMDDFLRRLDKDHLNGKSSFNINAIVSILQFWNEDDKNMRHYLERIENALDNLVDIGGDKAKGLLYFEITKTNQFSQSRYYILSWMLQRNNPDYWIINGEQLKDEAAKKHKEILLHWNDFALAYNNNYRMDISIRQRFLVDYIKEFKDDYLKRIKDFMTKPDFLIDIFEMITMKDTSDIKEYGNSQDFIPYPYFKDYMNELNAQWHSSQQVFKNRGVSEDIRSYLDQRGYKQAYS